MNLGLGGKKCDQKKTSPIVFRVPMTLSRFKQVLIEGLRYPKYAIPVAILLTLAWFLSVYITEIQSFIGLRVGLFHGILWVVTNGLAIFVLVHKIIPYLLLKQNFITAISVCVGVTVLIFANNLWIVNESRFCPDCVSTKYNLQFILYHNLIVVSIYLFFILYGVLRGIRSLKNKYAIHRGHNTDSIVLKHGKKISRIDAQHIKYVKSEGNYVKISTVNGLKMIYMSMKELEKKLPESKFVRVHRCYIVAVLFIQTVDKKTIEVDSKNIPIGPKYLCNLKKIERIIDTQFN